VERWYTKLVLCLLPLALVPGLLFSLAEGWINLGGGEKDIILVFPAAAWALLYACGFAVMWARKASARSCLWCGALVATMPLVVAWVGLLTWSLLGGRF
jgi:hypothetical protein